jgi:lipoprotein-anchoring transpeptidase ErfK/SrfK
LALLAGTALAVTACSSGGGATVRTVVQTPGDSGTSPATSSSTTSTTPEKKTAPPSKPVHVKVNIADGARVGVGLPVIATFRVKVTDGAAFQKATRATVNGAAAAGAWYFEYSDPASGHLMEAHYRLQHYWPGHARVHIDMPLKGLPAGKGLAFDNSLTLDFVTGPANIAVVDDSTHKMTVTSDGKPYGVFPVSLGANDTPTKKGIKVIMDKGADVSMRGPDYFVPHVRYTQRLTYSGEYLHAAPWNVRHIGNTDTSNGCTNLLPADAIKLFGFLRIGDVVQYPNIAAPAAKKMQLGMGYGDWNVPWSLWQTGGAVRTG